MLASMHVVDDNICVCICAQLHVCNVYLLVHIGVWRWWIEIDISLHLKQQAF